MAIPDYQSCMLPLLKYASDNQEHSLRDAIDKLASEFRLTDDEQKELLPSGQQAVFVNRVGWARTYMKKAGLLESTRRGYFIITNRGLEALKLNSGRIDLKFLDRYEEFREFRKIRREKAVAIEAKEDIAATPGEIMESAYGDLREELIEELLQQINTCSPNLFEKIVVELLVKMGYGGNRIDAGRAIGRSGDEGIDGIIKEDKLGLDVIYIQAKRWENIVSRPEIQKFAGALQGQRARKGIFITTSDFSKEAYEYVSKIDTKIILINGNALAKLMIDTGVGASAVSTYEIKRIDTDYFNE